MADNNSSWEAYSKMVLKELENLSASINGLRQEMQEFKSEIAEIRGQQENIRDMKAWKEKLDEVCSPSQLKTLKEEVEDLRVFKAKAITVFAVIQFIMGGVVFVQTVL